MTHPQTNPSSQSATASRTPWWLWLVRLCLLFALLLALVLVSLFYMAGTERGTAFLLEKITAQADVALTPVQGNLRDGLWVKDVEIRPDADLTIKVDRAYVELGWKSLWHKQVHLVNPKIDSLIIHNKKAPTGEPFDYPELRLPISLTLDNPDIQKIRYEQTGAKPVELTGIRAKQAKWSDATVSLVDAALAYDQAVEVKRATGRMEFVGDYPLKAQAEVHVKALDQVYFDTLSVQAGGSLKRSTGRVVSKYNGFLVQGGFIAQGLDEGVPFSAWLDVEHAVLPYATAQNITLSQGKITADGVLDRINLRINTNLEGKHIPKGRYHGRAVVRDGGMDVDYLAANTQAGILTAQGKMEWSDEFELDAKISGQGVQIAKVLPKDFLDYQDYLPKTLTGDLDFRYFYRDDQEDTRYELDLNQKDGERISAVIAQNQARPSAPWRIDAKWANLKRDRVPQVGQLDSKSGWAKVVVDGDRVTVKTDADITKLHQAPAGRYVATVQIDDGKKVAIDDLS